MEKFKISDIQEIFTSDVERFHSLTEQHVSQLLNEATVSQESLDEALRQCHTLKGLAATVEAWGLACLGADFEKLLELAGSWAHNERQKANEVFQFILDHMQDWFVMNQFTCMDMLPQSWDVYQGLRVIMEERWSGYLPVAEVGAEATDAQYVRLNDLEISELETIGVSGLGSRVSGQDPKSQNLDPSSVAEVKAGLDVQGALPIGGSGLGSRVSGQDPKSQNLDPSSAQDPRAQTQDAKSGAPLPVRVVPPTLRHRDKPQSEAEKVNQAESPQTTVAGSELKSTEATTHAEQPATPKPLQVVPPTLRRRDGASQQAQNAEASVESTSTAPAELVDGSSLMVDGPSTINPQPSTAAATVTPPTNEAPPSVVKVDALSRVSGLGSRVSGQDPKSQNLDPSTRTPGTSTPPILRVTPPALKRRGKPEPKAAKEAKSKRLGAHGEPLLTGCEAAALPAETPTEPVPTARAEELAAPASTLRSTTAEDGPGEPSAADVLSAEAIFAALPEAVEAEFAATVPVEQSVAPVAEGKPGEFKLAKDSDLLDMLSQEVAGYLTELSASLTALAGNLAATEPWEQTRRLFHTIKGTAATFGLDAVSAPAKAAEARCMVALSTLRSTTAEDGAEALARSRDSFESCVQRAAAVAKSLHLGFDDGRLRQALETALAQAANAAAANAPELVATLDPEMAGFFINDTRDQISIIEQAVLRWERLALGSGNWGLGTGAKPETRDPRPEIQECLQAAQRGFHTIKGAGNSIGLTAVALSVHEVEAFLEGVAAKMGAGNLGLGSGENSRDPKSEIRDPNWKAIFTFLLGAVDQLRRYLVGLAKNASTPWRQDWSTALRLLSGPAGEPLEVRGEKLESSSSQLLAPSSSEEEEEAQTIRIETARLYQLMNLISEMVIDRARLARKIEQLAGLHRALAERQGALTGSVLNFQEQFEFNLMPEQKDAQTAHAAAATPALRPLLSSVESVSRGEFSELEFDRYDQFNVLARSLVEISHDIEQLNGEVAGCLDSFAAEHAQFTQTSQELQGQVTSLGLVPVKTLFPRLQRAFRDALAVAGKDAELVLAGGEAMLDKVVVDKVYAPLLHLLRNAVAHGIEAGPTRLQRKKPARGRVWLGAAQLSNQIVLQLSDDGGGVDVAAVRARAIAKGWLAAESPELSAEQVVGLIFRPGFSTAAAVTSVAGRGIGLDVVRQEVEGLNGAVELKFVPGQGCTWTLRLPLTLAISEAILAEVGGTQFAFPLNFVEAGLILDPERLVLGAGSSALGAGAQAPDPKSETRDANLELYPVERRNVGLGDGSSALGAGAQAPDPKSEPGELGTGNSELGTEEGPQFDLLPVLRLSRLFGMAGVAQSNKGLVVGVGDRRAIVVVDVVLRRQEIVVKQLDSVLAQHPLLNGASVDAEGRVIPILNLPSLLKLGDRLLGLGAGAARAASVAPLVARTQTRVLVVDDSLSVRKVQERLLRELGCVVTPACDGLAALERLREEDFDLIFTDLEMPRLNGYELISELRGNPAWSEVPVVVISSRGADKYITKAMNLGASTFLSKPFTQEQLRQVLKHYAKGWGTIQN